MDRKSKPCGQSNKLAHEPFPVCPGKARFVRAMFSRIARRYDLLNTVMTWGRDKAWRRCAVSAALPQGRGRLLDAGAGTGALAREAVLRSPHCHVVAVDFAPEMVAFGAKAEPCGRILWCLGDALSLPFPPRCFDGVVSGFLLRNTVNAVRALREQIRVVKPGGRVAALETVPPSRSAVRPAVRLYLRWIVPALGRFLARDRRAYAYLRSSTESFATPEELGRILQCAGAKDVGYRLFGCGTVVVLWGTRPR